MYLTQVTPTSSRTPPRARVGCFSVLCVQSQAVELLPGCIPARVYASVQRRRSVYPANHMFTTSCRVA